MNKLKNIFAIIALALSLASCDGHHDPLDTSMKIGHVVCSDGAVVSLEECQALGKEPLAVVFYVSKNASEDYRGFAVYIKGDTPTLALADSAGISQKTSCDITEYDGNANTYSLYSNAMCGSPLAEHVYDMWKYGQSAYIPSVAQMHLLYQSKPMVNAVIRQCGGVELSGIPDESWLWTSTEVEGQDMYKAWLYSTASGLMHETPKSQSHKARPIVTVY